MKTIEELFNEVMADKALRSELVKAIKAGKQEEFFKAHGCNATTQEAIAFVKPKIASGELTIPDDLWEKLIWG